METKGFAAAFAFTLPIELGHANNPHDPGGNTQDGITQRTYDSYRTNKQLPLQDVQLINPVEREDVYHSQCWNTIKGDALPEGISAAIFDFAVNSGATRAIEELQRVIGVAVDGSIGQHTIASLNAAMANGGGKTVIELYCAARLKYCQSLTTFKYFGIGWTRRIEGRNNGVQQDDIGIVDYAYHLYLINLPATLPLIAGSVLPAPVPTAASLAALSVAPAPIGTYPGEQAGKATDAAISALRTTQGRGVVLSSTGTASTLVAAIWITAMPHIGPLLGIRLFVFAGIAVASFGTFLIWWNFKRRQAEKAR